MYLVQKFLNLHKAITRTTQKQFGTTILGNIGLPVSITKSVREYIKQVNALESRSRWLTGVPLNLMGRRGV